MFFSILAVSTLLVVNALGHIGSNFQEAFINFMTNMLRSCWPDSLNCWGWIKARSHLIIYIYLGGWTSMDIYLPVIWTGHPSTRVQHQPRFPVDSKRLWHASPRLRPSLAKRAKEIAAKACSFWSQRSWQKC